MNLFSLLCVLYRVKGWDLYRFYKINIKNIFLVIGVLLTNLGFHSLLLYIGRWVGVRDALSHFYSTVHFLREQISVVCRNHYPLTFLLDIN